MSGVPSRYEEHETPTEVGGLAVRSPATQRRLLADYGASMLSSEVVRGTEPAALDWRVLASVAGNIRLQELLEEVGLGCAPVKAEVSRFGPGLAQSGLLAMLELRLPETYGHAQRVARSAVALASAMELPDGEVKAVRCAALLHDIGKIAIPSRLLGQPGRLADDEIAVLRLHVTLGAEMLSEIPSLTTVASLVAATHERYDGTGYPNRLMGSDIPLAARIIAVADCYDAMTAQRPYSDPVSREEAHYELVRCAGSHFDPAVVREWIAMLGMSRFPWTLESVPQVRGAARGRVSVFPSRYATVAVKKH